MPDNKCVLAFSGGLDTSAIVPWLTDQGYEVHAVIVDVGQDEDFSAIVQQALGLGAATAVVRDAKPAMYARVVPVAIGLGATYEGNYRLGTALARPFIALEQVKRAHELGGAALAHGATGKGNDQIRFEFAYRSLAPQYPVIAPWKIWAFEGRIDLINYLQKKGFPGDFAVSKTYSLDENLWHLSIEGGALEDPQARVDVPEVLQAVVDRFAGGGAPPPPDRTVQVTFERGGVVAVDGQTGELPELFTALNHRFRGAAWAWDLVIENRFTGVKSRGVYINPAAKLLHVAADALARCCLNKPMYDHYVELGGRYGTVLYRGEFFSDQRRVIEQAARACLSMLSGTVTVTLHPWPYVSQIGADQALFTKQMATFEKSDFSHQDANGFIRLSWLSLIGKPFAEECHADVMEAEHGVASDLCAAEPLSGAGLVSTGA